MDDASERLGTLTTKGEVLGTINHLSHGEYRFGAPDPLKRSHLPQMVKAFQAPDPAAGHPTVGRRSISRVHLDDWGPVIVKHYRRGGLLALLVAGTYFKMGPRRCQIEFVQMQKARRLGVRTPEPIAFAYKGHFFYQAWLVTREVQQAVTLAQLSRISPERTEAAMRDLGRQLEILVAHRMRHADFHPGNVLVDDRNQVYILDFDKAGVYGGSGRQLHSAYIRRWCRAVRKHKLPSMLCELAGVNPK